MKKMILALMLAIVSSAWMANEASNWCMPSARTTTEPWIEVNGTFQAEGFPCEPEPDEVCPTCLTIVLVTNNKTYYLVTDDGQLIEYLDTIQLGTKATVSGIPFEHGSYDYIQVSHIETDQKLPSLCDEWNVLHEPFSCDGIYCRLQTLIYRLTTDTLIQDVNYVKLMEQEGSNTYYKGAMREGTNRDIYYVPAGSTNEFLLYAFNAQVGEVLNDLYLGGFEENGYSGRVEAISDSSPRLFTIRVLHPAGMGVEPGESFSVTWIEGVGSPETPYGLAVVPTVPADIGVYTLLCAYKNGEQVYTSAMGEQYGCEYNYNPDTTHTDTIPLYIKDGPGSSTVDPVDPNQIYATLMGNVLTVHNNTGAQVTFTVNNISVKNVAARVRSNVEPVSFTDSVSTELSEDGIYEILLTSEEWNYTIFGMVNYIRSAAGNTKEDPASTTKKILRGTQILIEREGKTYTLTGQEVK